MKIVHTADWHIGKIVNERSMIGDQVYILKEWLKQTKMINPDLVLMTGDLYDRSLASKEAVHVTNNILTAMVEELDCPICIISGNHDSGEHIAYANQLLQNQQLYMVGLPSKQIQKVTVGEADVYMLPFADYASLRRILENEEIHSISQATRLQVEQIKSEWDPNRINLLMFHGYVTGSDLEEAGSDLEESDSERPISIGTAEYVPVEVFKDFDYVALGHLHKAQKVGSQRVRYSGSPLKYSKSEVNHLKQFLEIDLDKSGIEVTTHPLIAKHDMRTIKGDFNSLIQSSSDDYVFIELTDQVVVHEGMNRLRNNYPHAMSLIYTNLERQEFKRASLHADKNKLSNIDLFAQFYEDMRNEKLNDSQRQIAIDIFNEIKEE